MLIGLIDNVRHPYARYEDLSFIDIHRKYFDSHITVEVKPGMGPKELTALKSQQPAFTPAFCANERVTNENVQDVHFLVFDLDDVPEDDLVNILAYVSRQELAFSYTSSFSDGLKGSGTRGRLLIPLDKPVPANEWGSFWAGARRYLKLGKWADNACRDPRRLYFLPIRPSIAPEEPQNVFVDGRPLRVGEVPRPKDEADEPSPAKRVSKDDIKQLVWELKKKGPRVRTIANKLELALEGKSFAEEGERDDTLFKMAAVIAENFPDVDPLDAALKFEAGFEALAYAAPDAPTLEHFAEKIQRCQAKTVAEIKAKQKKFEEERTRLIYEAFGRTGRTEPYTEVEIVKADQAWIVQHQKAYFVWVGGDYRPPLTRDAFLASVERDLSPAHTANVTPFKILPGGDLVRKSSTELVSEYGQVAYNVSYQLGVNESRYDFESRELKLAACPLRKLEPEYNAEIDGWLNLFQPADKLKDWLAVSTQLQRPCSALYLDGVKSAGKSLLAKGVSRMWSTHGETTLENAIGQWNDDIRKCPLVFADEVLPTSLKDATGRLRQFIQDTSRPLTQKFLPNTSMEGAVRLILAANNRSLLDTDENLTQEDIEAISERFLYVRAPAEAAQYLSDMGGPPVVSKWVEEDLLARHTLWLAANRQVESEGRFFFDGSTSELSRALIVRSYMRSNVCAWLVNYLLSPSRVQGGGGLIGVKDGRLLVSARALHEYWEVYNRRSKPTEANLSRALSGLCKQDRVSYKGKKVREVDLDNLYTWVEETDFCDVQELTAALSGVQTNMPGANA